MLVIDTVTAVIGFDEKCVTAFDILSFSSFCQFTAEFQLEIYQYDALTQLTEYVACNSVNNVKIAHSVTV